MVFVVVVVIQFCHTGEGYWVTNVNQWSKAFVLLSIDFPEDAYPGSQKFKRGVVGVFCFI